MPQGRTPITWNMTVRDALLNVINEDMEELFSRVEALELGKLAGLVLATEEEAVAGLDNTKAMTPLRVHQAIAANPSAYLNTVDHTKALHDSLGINADTLDGYHGAAFRRNDENINLSQGQIVDFADEAGDKIQLHGTQYGIAINANELTLYAPPASEIAVRDSAYNGQKRGDVIHTGNINDKGVAKRISLTESTAGDFVIRKYDRYSGMTLPADSYVKLCGLYIPWIGTMRYRFIVYSGGNASCYIKLNSQEYGPYTLPSGTNSTINIDSSNTGSVDIYMKSPSTEVQPNCLEIRTGSLDIVHDLMTTYMHISFMITYPLEAHYRPA